MNGPEPSGEFEVIAKLLRPLAQGHLAALGLSDDAAVLPGRPGYDLVVSKDAMVAGVHFLPDMPMDIVGQRLLRAALSDLAAKAAEPAGWFMAAAWPAEANWAAKEAFARGLAEDGVRYAVPLLGGDTVSTSGPLTLSATVMGWTPAGRMVRRGGGRAGDILMVSGTIGDGWLGLQVATGALPPDEFLRRRYNLPEPRFELRAAIQAHAKASADVSDGLLADVGHIAAASGLSASIDLERTPLSASAAAWLGNQPDRALALSALASGGDDYEVVVAVAPEHVDAYVQKAGMPVTTIGRLVEGQGIEVRLDGVPIVPERLGYRHDG